MQGRRRHTILAGMIGVITVVAATLAACGSSATAIDVWVRAGAAPGGDGSQAHPFAALSAARDAIRPKLPTMSADATVHIASGTYVLSDPFVLTSADSGMNGHRVVYRADGASPPIISGGTTITGWAPAAGKPGVWSAPVPPTLKTRQLYVNGVRAQVARATSLPFTLTQTETGYTASSDAMASWPDPTEIEMVYPSGPSNWTESRCRVASISGMTITMVQPCWDNTTKRDTSGTSLNVSGFGQKLTKAPIVTNALPLLTQPGQWFFDQSAGVVYYMPRTGEDMATATVVAPVLETLVQGQGSVTAPVHDVAFRGLIFSYATWIDPSLSSGYSSFQAGTRLTGPDAYRLQGACDSPQASCPYTGFPQMPGNVSFTNDQRIQFTSDTFTHLGAAGLSLGDGSQNDVVAGCAFTDVSGSGLSLGGIDQPDAKGAERVSDNVVSDNYIHGTGVEFQDTAGLFVGYADHTTISHNQLDDLPYSGMSIGWGGWQERLPGKPALANYSSNNLVESNLIFDYMKALVDGGGIYTNGIEGTSMADAERILGNVVLDQHDLSWGIYDDNGLANVKVAGNVVWDVMYVPVASMIFPGVAPQFSFGGCSSGPVDYNGNYSIQTDPSQGLVGASPLCGGHPLTGVTVESNHVISSLSQAPTAVMQAAGIRLGNGMPYHLTPPISPPANLPPYNTLG